MRYDLDFKIFKSVLEFCGRNISRSSESRRLAASKMIAWSCQRFIDCVTDEIMDYPEVSVHVSDS